MTTLRCYKARHSVWLHLGHEAKGGEWGFLRSYLEAWEDDVLLFAQ